MADSKWDDKYVVDLYTKMAAGMSDVQVRVSWNVSKGTFYRWLKEHPELKDAHERGKDAFDAIHEDYGVQGMLKQNDIDYQFWRDLGKFRHGWAEKSTNTQINIDTMNVLNEQTNEELLAFIRNQVEKHPELSNIIEGEFTVDD